MGSIVILGVLSTVIVFCAWSELFLQSKAMAENVWFPWDILPVSKFPDQLADPFPDTLPRYAPSKYTKIEPELQAVHTGGVWLLQV
jgi:hypothetical protein